MYKPIHLTNKKGTLEAPGSFFYGEEAGTKLSKLPVNVVGQERKTFILDSPDRPKKHFRYLGYSQ